MRVSDIFFEIIYDLRCKRGNDLPIQVYAKLTYVKGNFPQSLFRNSRYDFLTTHRR